MKTDTQEYWRHVKTNGVYRWLMSVIRESDKEIHVVYQGTDGRRWARPSKEFYDGRFVRLEWPYPGIPDAWRPSTPDLWKSYGGKTGDYANLEMRILANTPIPMVLYCPKCHEQHIDKPEGQFIPGFTAEESEEHNRQTGCKDWSKIPHRSHLCHNCGHIWRPSGMCTVGVANNQTFGKNDKTLVRRVRKIADKPYAYEHTMIPGQFLLAKDVQHDGVPTLFTVPLYK